MIVIASGAVSVTRTNGQTAEGAFCETLGELLSDGAVLDHFLAGRSVVVQRGVTEIRWEVRG